MSIEVKNSVQETIKNLEAQEQTPETVESIRALKEAFNTEVVESVAEFKAEDGEVEKIEQSINIKNPELVKEVEGELKVEETLQNLDSKANVLKNEVLRASDLEKQQEEKTFIDSFDLSPQQRKDLKDCIENLNDQRSSPIALSNLRDKLPPEILKSDFVRSRAEKIFYNSIVHNGGSGSGSDWIDYGEMFGIKEEFFKQEDFIPFKKERWLTMISCGHELNNPDRFKENYWEHLDPQQEEKRRRAEEIQLGTLESVGLSPDMPEARVAAVQGIISSIWSDFSMKEDEADIILKEYKEIFKITDEDLQERLKNQFEKGKFQDYKKIDQLRLKYSFIEKLFTSQEMREIAIREAESSFISLNDTFSENTVKYFKLTEKEFDKENLRERQRALALLETKKQIKTRDEQYSFYTVESMSKYLEKEDWQKIFQDNSITEKIVGTFAGGLRHDFYFDKNIEVFKKIDLPKDILRKASIVALERRFYDDSEVSPEVMEVFSNKLGLMEADIKEGLSLGILTRIERHDGVYNIKRLQEKLDLPELFNSPAVQEKAKKLLLKNIENADMVQIETIQSVFDVEWTKEDLIPRREAVKKSITEGQLLNSYMNIESIDEFISKHYPETHKLFLLHDPEVKAGVEKSLCSSLFYEFNSRNAPLIQERARYFNIPIEKLAENVRSRISNGYFIDNANDKVQNRFQKNLGIDVLTENENCLEKYAVEIIDGALEKKDWKLLLDVGKYENGKSIVQEKLLDQEKNIGNSNKSIEQRTYATEIFLKLDPSIKAVSGTISNLFNNNGNQLKPEFKPLVNYDLDKLKEFVNLLGTNYKDLGDFKDANHAQLLNAYIDITEEENSLNLTQDQKNIIKNLFDGPYRDTCLAEVQKEWKTFLTDKEAKSLPPKLFLISRAVESSGGAGNLKHVESISNLMQKLSQASIDSHTAERTTNEVKELLRTQENRIEKEKWSQEDRSEFYNLSHDIIEASPSLFATFSPIIEQIPQKDMKIFMKEVFPFYQAQLVVLQNIKNDSITYNARDLVHTRQNLNNLVEKLQISPENAKNIFEEEKTRLIEIMRTGFKDRFGLMKVPDNFTKEDLRSIQNGIRYVGNISNRNAEREAVIALYIGLEINGEWSAFRQGKEINIEEYFTGSQLETLRPLIEEKRGGYTRMMEVAGISEEQMPRFQEILQEDTISNMIGNVQTVDVKLANIQRNVQELADPDIYEKQIDKDIINLLTSEGKAVGSILSKIHSESSGKSVVLTDIEKLLRSKIADIFDVKVWNTDEVKRIQNEIQPLSLVSNIINKMDNEKVDENIQELEKRLVPSTEIIEIFNRLGENFKQESGAMALSKDIAYLENIIVKDDKKLNPDEKEAITKYLGSIKEKMKELEGTLDKVKEYFQKLKKSSQLENHALLKDRLSEVEKIINTTDSNAMIVSHMTKDLNLIIENMRQCLGCMRKEANNDTNLSFGDYNKFFMMNQSEKEKGSISDEIVFFAPIKMPHGNEEMTFVMDRVYGTKSPDVLIGNILSVYKKYEALRKEAPESHISISISQEAMSSVGLDSKILKQRLDEVAKDLQYTFVKSDEGFNVDIPKSAFSDNYVEFSSSNINSRDLGNRQFEGLILH